MEKFLENLYNYEFFGFYLIISIIVLIILFLIILFFGKKDKKEREIEATKKLQQINSDDAFKEESQIEKLEINTITEEKLENDTIVVPSIEEIPTIGNVETSNEIVEPTIPISEPEVESLELDEPEVFSPVIEEPLLEKVEEKPLMVNTTVLDNNFIEQVTEKPQVEDIQLHEEEISVPTFDYDELLKEVEEVKEENKKESYSKGPQIFSSVYVPEKKEEIEIPKVETPIPSSDELDLEMPVLKKEVKEEPVEMPALNDYNLDDLSGETYTIEK